MIEAPLGLLPLQWLAIAFSAVLVTYVLHMVWPRCCERCALVGIALAVSALGVGDTLVECVAAATLVLAAWQTWLATLRGRLAHLRHHLQLAPQCAYWRGAYARQARVLQRQHMARQLGLLREQW